MKIDSFETIKVEVNDSVARLTLNRPEKHNAINSLMIHELLKAAELLGENDSVRVVVLAAEGKSFCAGGDLGWMKEQAQRDRAAKIEQSTNLAIMLRKLDELPKPLIGRVQGPAYGGGVGLISVCDITVASTEPKFALTETKLGLIPATIGPYVVRRLGEANARQVFMNGKSFDAQRAVKLSLISKVVPESELDQAIEREVEAFMNCAPGAVAQAKSLCLELARKSGVDQLEYSANKLADRWETEEAMQGIDAFFNRDKPPWTK